VLVVVVALFGVVVAQGPYANQELASNVYRVSPYGRCSATAAGRLRANLYPCFAETQFTFPNITTTNTTVPKITSLLGLDIGGFRTLYVGNTDRIQVVRPDGIFAPNVTRPVYGYTVQTFATTLTPRGDFVGSFSDGSTYVAFINSGGIIAKYPLFADGTLNATGATVVATGVAAPTSIITRLPTVIIAGTKSIAVVDAPTLTVNTTLVENVVAGAVQAITCGAAANDDASILYYATNNGIVFTFDRVRAITLGSYAATGVTFSRSCAARSLDYGIFFSTTGSVYQFDYSATSLSAPVHITDGIGQGRQVVGVSSPNSDGSAIYLMSYTPGGDNLYLDNVYEFRLYADTYDFSSLIQYDQIQPNVFIDPTTLSPIVNNSIYIGASGSQIPRIYELLVPATYTPDSNPNATTLSHLVPDFTLPTNPSGAEGKVNSIADTTRSYSNGDLIFGNGVGFFPSLIGNNDSSSIPSRGPIITYLRGTQSEFPNHGGSPNTAGISFKLVSLDEVTANGNNISIIRTMPFYAPSDAPWVSPRDQNQQQNGPNAGITGITWTAGLTNTITLGASQYNYIMPPRARIVNNTVPTQAPLSLNGGNTAATSRKKRSVEGPNQFTPGYIGMTVTLSTYGTNVSRGQITDIPYNVTSRTFLYSFSVINYPFTSTNNFLRLTLAVGLGADGNTSLGSGILGANSTLAPLIPGYLMYTETADWTLLMPQKAAINSAFRNAPYNCSYDTQSQIMSVYLPVAAANSTISYTFAVEYSYVSTPPPPPNLEDGGGPKLLPLWIVIGVVGGLLIIAIIIAIIVIIVVYKVAGDKIKAWIVDNQFDQTEGALREDRGPF